MNQRKLHSLIEVCVSTLIGFIVAMMANALILPIYGLRPSLNDNIEIAAMFTIISVIRGYLVRRLFNLFT